MSKIEYKIGDAFELIKDVPDKSINLVIADPPYYKIKDDKWDHQWKSFDEYLDWIEQASLEIKRVLTDNGSFYIFGDDKNIAYIQVRLDKHFVLLNNLVWYKRNNISIKWVSEFRSYAPVSERILFYGNGDKTGLAYIHENCFQPIKEYMRGELAKVRQKYNLRTVKETNEFLNKITDTRSVVSRHYFSDSQWRFPTEKLYKKLQTTGFFKRPYTNQKREDEGLREEYERLRRPFNYQKGIYEVIDVPIITGKENTSHSTTKPFKLMEILVKASSNMDDNVLDPFAGSGTVGAVCQAYDRNCLMFEINPDYEPLIRKRCHLDSNLAKYLG
jgi:site-specific DNA-methyltransferase (adenine-specific)